MLCVSCRCSFPPTLLAQPAFTEHVGTSLERVQDLIRDIEGKTAEDVHRLQQLRVGMQDLCASVHEESRALREKISLLEGMRSRREGDETVTDNKTTMKSTGSSSGPDRLSNSSCARASTAAAMNAVLGEGANRAPFNACVPGYLVRKASTALELISASIYSLLESLAIRARVDTALLWMRPRGFVSMELVAPFVVGRDLSKLRNSAPYCAPEMSIPCAVSSTGIAVNITPSAHVRDTRRSEDISLTELVEKSNAAQLLVPVYVRYGDVGKTVAAVIHLIGSPRVPFPFSRFNEEMATQAASFLSNMLSSHYDLLIAEWTNRFFDPSVLSTTGTYRATLDLRGDEKGIDDFAAPPTLIYRYVNECHNETDAWEAFKQFKSALTRCAQPTQPVASIKDLHRYAARMENNWASAVDTTTHLENVIDTLSETALQEELRKLKEQRETQPKEPLTRIRKGLTASVDGCQETLPAPRPVQIRESVEAAENLTGCLHAMDMAVELAPASVKQGLDASDVLKNEEVDELEYVALQRLRDLGVDTDAFLTQKRATV